MIRKEIFATIFLFVLYFNLVPAQNKVNAFPAESGSSAASWKFNYQLAKTVFQDANSDFGFYVLTPDEWGYGPRYALVYAGKAYSGKTAEPNTKKHITYVIMAPPINGMNNNGQWWIKNRVRIDKAPESVINYVNEYRVEKFILTNDEIKIPSDPNLVNGLFFR